VSSGIVASAVAAEVTRRNCFSRQNPPPYVGGYHSLNATMLHLLGLDHERLTYRYQGRAFRLTDVHGKVVNEIVG
jgi:hypothetical protein